MKHSRKRFSTGGLWLLLLAVLNGCASAKKQEFTGLTPDQAPLLLAKSKHVLEVSTKPLTQRADYNLRENLRMLAPVPRKWKIDLEWKVKRVLKGNAPGTTLLVKDMPFPSDETRNLGFAGSNPFTNPFTDGLILWIGFDAYEDFHFKNLKLVKASEEQIQLSLFRINARVRDGRSVQ